MAGVAWGERNIIFLHSQTNTYSTNAVTISEQIRHKIDHAGTLLDMGYMGASLNVLQEINELKIRQVENLLAKAEQSPTNKMEAVSLSLMTDSNGPGRTTTTPEQIRKLAKSGKICDAMGFHCWGEIKKVWVAEPHDPSCVPWEYELCDQRKCKLCGKVETMEWK